MHSNVELLTVLSWDFDVLFNSQEEKKKKTQTSSTVVS